MRAKLAGVCLFVAALAPVTAVFAQEATPPTITDIRQESDERSTRLVIECTGPLTYTYYSPDPLTLVVDIPDVDASQVPARIQVGTREVDSLRITSLARADGRNLARLEVRLASLAQSQIFSKDRSLNLVFQHAATASTPAPAAGGKAPPAEAKAPPPAVAPSTPSPAASASLPPAAPRAQGSEEASPAAPEGASAVAEAVPAAAPDVPAPAAPPPAKPHTATAEPPSGPRATRIVAVSRDEVDGHVAVTVRADGRLKYQDFTLPNPDRVVVDFADVSANPDFRSLDMDADPVKRVRLAQFSTESPRVARLVLDLSSPSPYRIVEGTDDLQVVMGETGEPEPPSHAPLAALRSAEPAAPPAPEAPEAPAAARPMALEPLALPPLPEPQVPEPAAAASEVPAQPEQTAMGTACGQTGYLGTPISLDFKDGDLQDIFRLFSDISGLNVVVNPGVSGKVTLKLNEVPWGRALELILKTNGLGCVLEGNVIRIARLTDLEKEEQDRRKLAEAKALAGDLEDYTKRISYAKADTLSGVLKAAGALSPRGQLNVDARTNTIIIRDLPSYLQKAESLIGELDTATPQVEIEARIVVTTRDFVRDIGLQWGFGSEASNRYGNSTNLNYPNQIILNGNGVPSQLGLPADNTGPGGLSSGTGIGQAGRGYAVNLPAAGFNSAIGISTGNILGSFNLDLALTALERQGRGRLLSTPKVTTQNNQAAEIKQGIQIPIQTVANNTVTVQFKDAVLTLKVTPQITDAGTVILNVAVENSTPDFSRTVNGIPPINTQAATTIVQVSDGQTTVIGGIYQSTETTVENSTPFFSKIPILGFLFRQHSVNTSNNELLLFITPRIVKS
jgi:type IV pilus secretin PilQ/predicted competence protein